MRLRNYTLEEIMATDCGELARMHAANLRMIQLLDFGCVLFGAFFVMIMMDIFGV